MKRTLIALSVFLLVVGISIASSLFLRNETDALSAQAGRITDFAEAGDFSAAEKEADSLLSAFRAAEPWFLICIKSTPLEDIEEQLTALRYYAVHKDAEMLTAETEKVRSLIEHIWKTEQVTLVNVF